MSSRAPGPASHPALGVGVDLLLARDRKWTVSETAGQTITRLIHGHRYSVSIVGPSGQIYQSYDTHETWAHWGVTLDPVSGPSTLEGSNLTCLKCLGYPIQRAVSPIHPPGLLS